jgi:hypothetical protein
MKLGKVVFLCTVDNIVAIYTTSVIFPFMAGLGHTDRRTERHSLTTVVLLQTTSRFVGVHFFSARNFVFEKWRSVSL